MCLHTCFYLFVLSCSLRGKQVHQVPTELTNGVHNILTLHDSGQVNPKEWSSSISSLFTSFILLFLAQIVILINFLLLQILEDTGALILLFDNDEGRKIWQSRLQGAIYRASVIPALFLFLVNASITFFYFLLASLKLLVCLQGSAALSSFPEVAISSETNSFKGSFPDVDTEKLFVAGILDELKICFSCGYEVFILNNFLCNLDLM